MTIYRELTGREMYIAQMACEEIHPVLSYSLNTPGVLFRPWKWRTFRP